MKRLKYWYFVALAFMVNGCSEVGKRACSFDCKNEDLTDAHPINSGDDPVVCTLTGIALAERKEELQNKVFSNILKVEEIESGYIFSFKYDEQFILKLIDYIITENKCCPFFQFDFRLKSKNDVLLKISGPQEAKEMIKMLLIYGS